MVYRYTIQGQNIGGLIDVLMTPSDKKRLLEALHDVAKLIGVDASKDMINIEVKPRDTIT